MVNSVSTSTSPTTQSPSSDSSVHSSSPNNVHPKTKQRVVTAIQCSLLIIRIASIVLLGLGIALLAPSPLLGSGLLVAALALAITSLVCAIALSTYQTLTIRKLQKEVSSLEKRSDIIFVEPCVDEGFFISENPFEGLENTVDINALSPRDLSPEDRDYIQELVSRIETEN
ncbi:hypothetical protein FTM89_03385 [Chlamydia trachomatis]|uniref:Membrane protein n=2 Tax=Chlamydia muridarum TaxID=83560 RepID=A0A069ZZL2_CHLMR|nr:hypothetical protein [Chlamydia muridarum]UFT44025.1 hypothetical protein FTN72_03400 [Chlamydia trachomatis]AAF39466.1 hypothetical protein TC_0637 [Chlamydia muridarum str. Nigg]AHH23023.1 hypothetical protein TAC_03350 [Chlamydia muridarum str. Nigg3 CMUT3-5]AHH23948.1 hypothetical protein Y015_03350 [Chlamydia muridarum str. Nigg CM972]AID38155.1 membrane protein [Chlamydia muridarum str. Nigg 2 MCR]